MIRVMRELGRHQAVRISSQAKNAAVRRSDKTAQLLARVVG
jgi:hypothetical protein